jgi:hypothetical protein
MGGAGGGGRTVRAKTRGANERPTGKAPTPGGGEGTAEHCPPARRPPPKLFLGTPPPPQPPARSLPPPPSPPTSLGFPGWRVIRSRDSLPGSTLHRFSSHH